MRVLIMNVNDIVEHKFTFQRGIVNDATPDHRGIKVRWYEHAPLLAYVSTKEFRLISGGSLTKCANGKNT